MEKSSTKSASPPPASLTGLTLSVLQGELAVRENLGKPRTLDRGDSEQFLPLPASRNLVPASAASPFSAPPVSSLLILHLESTGKKAAQIQISWLPLATNAAWGNPEALLLETSSKNKKALWRPIQGEHTCEIPSQQELLLVIIGAGLSLDPIDIFPNLLARALAPAASKRKGKE